ncbi:MAG TPA: hypothetical protein VK206_28285, partial [Anaerolineales bacterium]|nr:hypothetical protein [Anaerolineales bacterium]
MQITIPPDPFSFLLGFAVGVVFVWLVGRMRPLFTQVRVGAKERREVAKTRRASGLEDNHRRITLRRA